MEEEIKDWIDDIKMEDIPSKGFGQYLARVLGMEKFLELVIAAGGLSVYIPKADMLIQPARARRIISEFDGGNYRELALKYNLSETWVRQIIQQDRDDKDKKSQCKLFEDVVNQ